MEHEVEPEGVETVIFARPMTLQDLLAFFDHDARTGRVVEALDTPKSKVEARGLVGSARAFLAAQAVKRNGGDHLFLLEDLSLIHI